MERVVKHLNDSLAQGKSPCRMTGSWDDSGTCGTVCGVGEEKLWNWNKWAYYSDSWGKTGKNMNGKGVRQHSNIVTRQHALEKY